MERREGVRTYPSVCVGRRRSTDERRVDPGTGLYYYRARYYSPKLGRFLQTDFIGNKDDLNLFAYVYNDALNKTDPTGTEGEFDALKFVIVVAGTDAVLPDATDLAAPIKVPTYTALIIGTAIGGTILWTFNELTDSDELPALSTENEKETPTVYGPAAGSAVRADHTKGKRPSTEEKHEKGKARQKQDRGGEKADEDRRRPPRKRPDNWKGPWPPPKPKQRTCIVDADGKSVCN